MTKKKPDQAAKNTADKPINVLYAIFEADPFIKTGGLGDVGGSLPAALKNAGANVRVILPKLDTIPEKYKAKMKPVASFSVPLGWRHQYCGIEMLRDKGLVYYFVDNEYYFKRPQPYGYGDDAERIAFFSKAITECIPYLPNFFPDVLHCNDWHTALATVFLREQYAQIAEYRNIKTVFSVHNLKFQGVFSRSVLTDVLGLGGSKAASDQLSFGDAVNYMQGALYYSDRLTTVSPTYADEICRPYFGEKMDGIFRQRRSILSGILNGINQYKNSPGRDQNLCERYNYSTHKKGKPANKLALQQELGLAENPHVPLIVLISRLTEQKGLDLILAVLEELLHEDLQLAVLGVGEAKYEKAFRYYQGVMPGKVSACITFDAPLSSRFYAGADMLLMPSKFEPCGLSQMIAMRYGTIPIVRETGGLKDSVIAYNQYEDTGDGFSFTNFNAHEMLFAIKHAVDIYRNHRKSWEGLMKRAMHKDFSWKASADQYLALYNDLIAQ